MWPTPNDVPPAVGASVCGVHSETVCTERLVLAPMSADVVRSILRGDWSTTRRRIGCEFPLEWREDGWRWLEPQADKGEQDDRYVAWGTRLAFAREPDVLTEGRAAVLAEVGFHGPPDTEGWAEIGYRVVARYRRHGFAEKAARALLRWATARGAVGIKASVSPGNTASIGLLRKLGFTMTGRYEHDMLGPQALLGLRLQ